MTSAAPEGQARTGRWILAALLCYALLHAAGRVAVSDSVELDEAEQVLLAHGFHWGYARQPPLYSWGQTVAFRILGTNVLALALVKALFLFAAYGFVYATAQRIGRSERTGLVAVTALVFIPQFCWELQRDLTHSAALVACVAATLYLVARIVTGGGQGSYGALGLAVGLGVLSKYNYAFFIVGLLGAWVSLPVFRPYLLRREIVLSGLIALALTLPHLAWVWEHRDWFLATAGPGVVETGSRWLGSWKSFLSLIAGAAFFVLPLVAVYFLFGRGGLANAATPNPSASFQQLLGRTMLGGLLVCLGIAISVRLHFKDRLLLPILMLAPVWLALTAGHCWPFGRQRLLIRLAGTVAVLLLAAIPLGTILGARFERPNRLTAPYRELSARLKGQGINPTTILAENRWLGGNLKLQFPASQVVVPELPLPVLKPGNQTLVVWNAEKRDHPTAALQQLAERMGWLSSAPPRYVQARYKFARQETMRLGFIIP